MMFVVCISAMNSDLFRILNYIALVYRIFVTFFLSWYDEVVDVAVLY